MTGTYYSLTNSINTEQGLSQDPSILYFGLVVSFLDKQKFIWRIYWTDNHLFSLQTMSKDLAEV